MKPVLTLVFCLLQVDADTMEMLRSINMGGLPGLTVQQVIIFRFSFPSFSGNRRS